MFIPIFAFHQITKKMIIRQKPGRKELPEAEKVKLVSLYLKKEEKEAIIKKWGSVSKAVRECILPLI
jgi:hypothetical protein